MHLSAEVLGDAPAYLMPEMLIKVEFYGEEPVGIELPPTVDLKVDRDRRRPSRARPPAPS